MIDSTVFSSFETSTRLVRGWLAIHPCESFPRKRAVAEVAAALLANRDADPETVAWPILRELSRQTIQRLRDFAERTIKR